MMYLDVGYSINWSKGTTGCVIDVAITCGFNLWVSYKTLINHFGKNQAKAYITRAITRVGIYTKMAPFIVNLVMTLLNFNIGGAIVYD